MFRKSMITVLTVAVVATSVFSASTSSASARNNNRRNAAIAGAALGLGAALLGAAAAQGRHGGYHDVGRRHGRRNDYRGHRRHCFEKPITRWSDYYDDYVVVGYRLVCR